MKRWIRACVRENARGAARDLLPGVIPVFCSCLDLALSFLAYRGRSPVFFSSDLVFGSGPGCLHW
jgi:hypothetical protein